MKRFFVSLSLTILFCLLLGMPESRADEKAEKPRICTFIEPFGPYGIWRAAYGDPYPYKMIIRDAANQGISDMVIFIQQYRGGPFLYPTTVKYARTDDRMEGRDYLKETLSEAERYGMKVWLVLTPPIGSYPGTTFTGLNNPDMLKLYEDVITEICEKYGKYKSLGGFFPHEVDCTEAADIHTDDLNDFSAYCKKNFGEEYTGSIMPNKTDPDDKWWRRYALYKNEIVNNFNRMVGSVSGKYGFKNYFCYYQPETYNKSWEWGYDLSALEKSSKYIWLLGVGEECKMYQHINGAFLDMGLGYKGVNLSQRMAYSFHGKPLSFFEFRTPNYMDAVRLYYSDKKFHQKWCGGVDYSKYGDVYIGYFGRTNKDLEIFYGQANMKKWLGLTSSWQDGRSPADVVVAGASVPFYLRYPLDCNGEYNRKVTKLMESLTRYTDIDGVLMESEFALQPGKLSQYKLIVIPEDIGYGLSDAMLESLRTYVKNGGKLLLISSGLVKADPDLTNSVDFTEEFCGLKVTGNISKGAIKAKSEKVPLADNKIFNSNGRCDISVNGAEVLVYDELSKMPILTQKGNVYYSAIGFTPDAGDFFGSVVKYIGEPSIELDGTTGIRLVEAVRKNNALCLSFFDQGKAKLRINAEKAGLSGSRLQVRNIITGMKLYDLDQETLKKGVDIEIKYINQPYVLAVAPESALTEYAGIFPASETFEGMDKVLTIENPQVAIAVPDRPGIKVGIYHNGYGTTFLFKLLENGKNMNPFMLPRLDRECLQHCDVIIIPQGYTSVYINAAKDILQEFVRSGKGILLTHTAVGYGDHKLLFPEIGRSAKKVLHMPVYISKESHPVIDGLTPEAMFEPGFSFDHIAIIPEKGVAVPVRNGNGQAVIAAGKLGKGKVVLNGMLPGVINTDVKNSAAFKEGYPEGVEKQILLNSINWLAGRE